jgi:hypothetical protein
MDVVLHVLIEIVGLNLVYFVTFRLFFSGLF